MTADDLREQARQVRIFDELAVMIQPDHADALADLIDATRSYLADPASRMDAALAALDALDALDQEATA